MTSHVELNFQYDDYNTFESWFKQASIDYTNGKMGNFPGYVKVYFDNRETLEREVLGDEFTQRVRERCNMERSKKPFFVMHKTNLLSRRRRHIDAYRVLKKADQFFHEFVDHGKGSRNYKQLCEKHFFLDVYTIFDLLIRRRVCDETKLRIESVIIDLQYHDFRVKVVADSNSEVPSLKVTVIRAINAYRVDTRQMAPLLFQTEDGGPQHIPRQ